MLLSSLTKAVLAGMNSVSQISVYVIHGFAGKSVCVSCPTVWVKIYHDGITDTNNARSVIIYDTLSTFNSHTPPSVNLLLSLNVSYYIAFKETAVDVILIHAR